MLSPERGDEDDYSTSKAGKRKNSQEAYSKRTNVFVGTGWTEDEDKELVNLIKAQLEWRDISKKLGRTERSLSSHYKAEIKGQPKGEGAVYIHDTVR